MIHRTRLRRGGGARQQAGVMDAGDDINRWKTAGGTDDAELLQCRFLFVRSLRPDLHAF